MGKKGLLGRCYGGFLRDDDFWRGGGFWKKNWFLERGALEMC